MKPRIRIQMLVLAAVLAGLVLYLSKVQWDSLRAIDNYEQVRLQRVLGMNAWFIKEVFELEFESIVSTLRLSGGAPSELAHQVQQRLATWQKDSRWPGLIEDIYLVSRAPRGPRVSLLQNTQPASFAEDTEFEKKDIFGDDIPPVWYVGSTVSKARGAEVRTVPSVPALLVETQLQPTPGAPLEAAWLVARLNKRYLIEQFLPDLVATFYAPPNYEDVQVAVVESVSRELIYSTLNVRSISDFGQPDQVYGLLDAGTDGEELPRNGMRPPPGQEAPPNWNRPPSEADHLWFRGFWARLFHSGHWQLFVRRDGISLADRAAITHRRALATSFGILALLAIAVALVVLLARRSESLAKQQINFVATVSHELRTPLAILSVAGENLSDSLVTDTARLQEYGHVIRKETRRLKEMVDNVLNLARREANTLRPAHQSVELGSLVEETLRSNHSALTAAGLTLELNLADTPCNIQGNAAALHSAISNLLSNSVKYARDGGWLKVSVRRSEASEQPEIEVSVEDKGPGVNPADQPHLFERFFRGRRDRADQVEGSGLGLAVVSEIVRDHGGRVSYRTSQSGGAIFTLHLPLPVS